MPENTCQTVQELAERLVENVGCVQLWIKSGDQRAVYIGKGWRVADTNLAWFLKAHKTAQRDQAGDPSAGPGGLTGQQEPGK